MVIVPSSGLSVLSHSLEEKPVPPCVSLYTCQHDEDTGFTKMFRQSAKTKAVFIITEQENGKLFINLIQFANSETLSVTTWHLKHCLLPLSTRWTYFSRLPVSDLALSSTGEMLGLFHKWMCFQNSKDGIYAIIGPYKHQKGPGSLKVHQNGWLWKPFELLIFREVYKWKCEI